MNREIAGQLELACRARDWLVLRKVIFGNFSTSKKSAERRCASRCASRVSMLATSMSDVHLGNGRVSARRAERCRSTSLKRPRTVVIIMWLHGELHMAVAGIDLPGRHGSRSELAVP